MGFLKYFIVVTLMISTQVLGNSGKNGDSSQTCFNIDLKYKPGDASVFFVGALLPTNTQEYFIKIQDQIKKSDIDLVPTVRNKMHVTLKFIGFTTPDDKQKLTTKLSELFSTIKMPKIVVEPDHLMLLKKPDGTPRMILAKLESTELEELFKTIEDKLEGLCKRDTKPYLAHVTLGTFVGGTKEDSIDIEKKLDAMKMDKMPLEINGIQVLVLPSNKVNDQYQDPTDYEKVYIFQAY